MSNVKYIARKKNETGNDGEYSFRVTYNYNYYSKFYEEYCSRNNISELQLPNFYDVIDNLVVENVNNEEVSGIFDDETKLELFANYDTTQPIINVGNNYYSYKYSFPFYCQISFKTVDTTEKYITEYLTNLNLYNELFEQIKNNSPISLDKIRNTNLDSYDQYANYTKLYNSLNGYPIYNKNNNNNYEEIIGYILTKYNTSNTTGEAIQTWYIPNIKETSSEDINIIDTQVKYGQLYNYKLQKIISINDSIFSCYVDEESFQYFLGNKILDYPPVEPNIEFVPYAGISDKVRIFLNTGIGRKDLLAHPYLDGEGRHFEDLKQAQERDDDKLTYQSDEPASKFQIFKSELAPTKYEDIIKEHNLLKNTEDVGSSWSYEDTNIKQNKKYYYSFRCVDNHDNVSPPTEIFQFEMINDGGAIYPLVRIYDMETKSSSLIPTKKLKRFLSIKPSLINTLVNEINPPDSISDINPGPDENAVWGKKIKIRLTSKSSGKKMDINFVLNVDNST